MRLLVGIRVIIDSAAAMTDSERVLTLRPQGKKGVLDSAYR